MKKYEYIKVCAIEVKGMQGKDPNNLMQPYSIYIMVTFPFPINWIKYKDPRILSYPPEYHEIIDLILSIQEPGEYKGTYKDYPYEHEVRRDMDTNELKHLMYFTKCYKISKEKGVDLDKLYEEYKRIPKRFKPVEVIREALEGIFDGIRR